MPSRGCCQSSAYHEIILPHGVVQLECRRCGKIETVERRQPTVEDEECLLMEEIIKATSRRQWNEPAKRARNRMWDAKREGATVDDIARRWNVDPARVRRLLASVKVKKVVKDE